MPERTLTDTLLSMEDRDELQRVSAMVDPHLELAAIMRRLADRSDTPPAILFENLTNTVFPVVSGVFGCVSRAWKLLQTTGAAEFEQRLAEFFTPHRPEGWLEALKLVSRAEGGEPIGCRRVKSAPVQQTVRVGSDVSLHEFPFVRCWPEEPAPVLNGGLLVARHPATSELSIDTFRLPLRDHQTLHVPVNPHHGCWPAWQSVNDSQTPLQVAVVIGGPPLYSLLAACRLPQTINPYWLGGFLSQHPTEIVEGRTVPLPILANADFVFEGVIDPRMSSEPCGPGQGVGNHYSVRERAAVITVHTVTHRQHPVWPVFWENDNELACVAQVSSSIFSVMLRHLLPEVRRVDISPDRQTVFVSIRKQFPQHGRQVMQAIWGFSALKTVKWIVVVDDHVDTTRPDHVWREVAVNAQPSRDTLVVDGPADYADHSTAIRGLGKKMGIDATRKWPEEGHPRAWPSRLISASEIEHQVSERWNEFGFGN